MFRRDVYRTLGRVLDALDEHLIARTSFQLGGDACLALGHDEYRVSRDLDVICSDARGYSELRRVARESGYAALFVAGRAAGFGFPREVQGDQYGVRFPVVVEGPAGTTTMVRVELIREARITLGPPTTAPWTRMPVLSLADAFAAKLLANSDRWTDPDDLSRDVIDLAVLRDAHGPIPDAAWNATDAAYGAAPREDLRRALMRFMSDTAYRDRCFTGLGVEADGGERVRRGAEALATDVDA